MMDTTASFKGRVRGGDINGKARSYAKNKSWVADGSGSRSGSSAPRGGASAEGRWERGSGRGTRGRGSGSGRGQTRMFHNASLVVNHAPMVEEHGGEQVGEYNEENHEEDYYEDYHEDGQGEEQGEEDDAEEVDELQDGGSDGGSDEPDFTDQAEFEIFYQQVDIPTLLSDLSLTF